MTKKTYGYLDPYEKSKKFEIQTLKPEPCELYDYQKKALETLNQRYFTNACVEVPISTVTTRPTTRMYQPQSMGKTTAMSAKAYQDMLDQYVNTSVWKNETYHYAPELKKSDSKLDVVMDDGKVETVTREELIKYIGERKIVQENEVVRKVYERYQVAVKLVRSDDNGDSGV